MKGIIYIALLSILLSAVQIADARENANELTIDLTSRQMVFTRDIGADLMLRVVKDSSVNYRDFGWILEVVKKPHRKNSRNLIYQNRTGTTADLSQIYAWHIGDRDFPNVRYLKIKNNPVRLKINLKNPKVKGTGPDARFVSGKLTITW